jgi:hypothetical protein
VAYGAAIGSDDANISQQGATDVATTQGMTRRSEGMGIGSEGVAEDMAILEGVATGAAIRPQDVAISQQGVAKSSDGTAIGSEGEALRQQGMARNQQNMAAIGSEGVASMLEGNNMTIRSEGLATELVGRTGGVAANENDSTITSDCLATKGGVAVSEDVTSMPRSKGIELQCHATEPNIRPNLESMDERVVSPITRIMEMVQFGKKNLASADTRFLGKLQAELQKICDSLYEQQPKAPSMDQRGQASTLQDTDARIQWNLQ